MAQKPNIVLVGAGRVATQLGKRLCARGHCPVQIINRHAAQAAALAEMLDGVAYSEHWSAIRADADWIILAVRDDAIEQVAAQIAPYAPNALVTHTSGTIASTVLAPHFARYGVFYPLQSFSLQQKPHWASIPLCLHANTDADMAFLKKMARRIGKTYYEVNDAQRAQLHLAAVFANNFANHCFHIAAELVQEAHLPFSLLQPLIQETAHKIQLLSPANAQTGPAIRGDMAVLARHMQSLQKHPMWQVLYEQMSADILRLAKNKNG